MRLHEIRREQTKLSGSTATRSEIKRTTQAHHTIMQSKAKQSKESKAKNTTQQKHIIHSCKYIEDVENIDSPVRSVDGHKSQNKQNKK
jgi:hypothetical protein